MDCVVVIEGTVKAVLAKHYEMFRRDRLDDTEYIRNVKAVLEGTDMFLQDNKEVLNPQKIKQVLYQFSKELWLSGLKEIHDEDSGSGNEESASEDDGYNDYYYDYIYNHGIYPR
ncbi:MAG: hypothetical protein GY749_38600 [Desulfobacteraceae bacterium]|nr:hypothetical protein [Desulfobacteraceae bacterium]